MNLRRVFKEHSKEFEKSIEWWAKFGWWKFALIVGVMSLLIIGGISFLMISTQNP